MKQKIKKKRKKRKRGKPIKRKFSCLLSPINNRNQSYLNDRFSNVISYLSYKDCLVLKYCSKRIKFCVEHTPSFLLCERDVLFQFMIDKLDVFEYTTTCNNEVKNKVEMREGVKNIVEMKEDVHDDYLFQIVCKEVLPKGYFSCKEKNCLRLTESKSRKITIRNSWTVGKKRMVVSIVHKRKNLSLRPRLVVGIAAKEFNIDSRRLREWLLKKELSPTYPVDCSVLASRRIGSPGRDSQYFPEIIKSVEDIVTERYEKELIVTRDFLTKFIHESHGIIMKPYQISRLLGYCDVSSKTKTSKMFSTMKEEDLRKHEKWIKDISLHPICILAGEDEKPVRKLLIGKKSIVPKGAKMISFEDGGRSAKQTVTLLPFGYAVLEFGKLKYCGVAGMGVIMRGKEYAIPHAWKFRKRNYSSEVNKVLKEFYLLQTPKSVMKGPLWVKFIPFFHENLRGIIKKRENITDAQYNSIPKYNMTDGAPGHNDKKGLTNVKELWSEYKTFGWKEHRLPPNSSEKSQWGDLGPNKLIEKECRVKSAEWVVKNPRTEKNHLQLPGKIVRLEWYSHYYTELKKDLEVIKTGWLRTGVCTDKNGKRCKFLWREKGVIKSYTNQIQ